MVRRTGLLDFKSILPAAKAHDIENCHVEVEGEQSNSLDVVEESINNMKALKL